MVNLAKLWRRLDPLADDGLALVVVLGLVAFFSVAAVTAVTMTRSTQTTASSDTSSQTALANAEAGINQVEAKLYYQNTSGGNPTAANLLGCAGAGGASDTTGPSNCTTPTPLAFCITAASGCTAGQAGTAGVFGYWSGANPGSYGGTSVPASTWLIVSKGYAASPNGGVLARSATALVKVSPLGSGAVGALWNHIFLTAPLVPNVCQTTFAGNNVSLYAPLYVIGNLCFSGNNEAIKENGQPIDLMVGGKLVYGGNGDIVGADSSHKITSGVVVGNCATSVSGAATPCGNGSWSYWVNTADTFISQDAPTLTNAQIENDYSTYDPGPKHTCLAGTTPSPLADNQFDFSIAANEGTSVMPDNTGSGSNGGAFELAPSSSYACISKNGSGVGYLIWNNGGSSITVNCGVCGSGITVPSKTLAINGSIFFDSNVTISQALTYQGTGIIEASGTITINGNSTTVCATSPCNTASSAWQGSSGNNSMLTLASLAANNANAIQMSGNSETFQGSAWTQPSSTMTLGGNTETVNGPMSIGSLNTSGNTPNIVPLPVIKNMPTGAPVPPNTAVTIGSPLLLK